MTSALPQVVKEWLHAHVTVEQDPRDGMTKRTYVGRDRDTAPLIGAHRIAPYLQTRFPELAARAPGGVATAIREYLTKDPAGPQFPPIVRPHARRVKRATRTPRILTGNTETRIRTFLTGVVPGVGDRRLREWAREIAEKCIVTETVTIRALK